MERDSDRDSTRGLRLDVRLLRRRGWIAQKDLDRELEALPDVSHKIAPPEAEEADAGPEAPAVPDPAGSTTAE